MYRLTQKKEKHLSRSFNHLSGIISIPPVKNHWIVCIKADVPIVEAQIKKNIIFISLNAVNSTITHSSRRSSQRCDAWGYTIPNIVHVPA